MFSDNEYRALSGSSHDGQYVRIRSSGVSPPRRALPVAKRLARGRVLHDNAWVRAQTSTGRAFAAVTCDGIDLLLSGADSSGARPLASGEQQEPGGWNRVVLAVSDLASVIASLKDRGVRFRNEMIAGPGGKQVQILDPDGNPIELFEPAARR
jgi:hypothetical protein